MPKIDFGMSILDLLPHKTKSIFSRKKNGADNEVRAVRAGRNYFYFVTLATASAISRQTTEAILSGASAGSEMVTPASV